MNCLHHALDQWHEHGGALRIVRSHHWGMPHVEHQAHDGTITHYVPPRDLAKPMQSLWGFEGAVRVGDDEVRGPMPMRGIIVGSWLLAAGVLLWCISKLWSRIK